MDQNDLVRKNRARLSKRLYPNLPTWEISIWTSGWIFAVGYSMYHLFFASKRLWRLLDNHDLDKGYLTSSRRDVSDTEWFTFSKVFMQSLPWICLHTIGTQFFQRQNQSALSIFHFLISLLHLYNALGLKPTLLLVCQPLVMYMTYKLFKNIWAVWTVALLIITFNDYGILGQMMAWAFEDSHWEKKYISTVIMFWVNSRCVSYCLDNIWGDVVEETPSHFWNFIEMLSFCFYIPLCISGPLITFKEYKKGMYGKPQEWTMQRLRNTIFLIFRYTFWYFVTEIGLHHLYFSAFRYQPSIASKMDMWTLGGLGYTMGQFFCMKYIFFYGINRPFVMADGIEPPYHPKCIGRIHLYSDMWRYFDSGLYKFMHTYIYKPVIGARTGLLVQLFGSTMCFSFVYLWHGIMPHVLIWSFLNYVGIVCESLSKAIWQMEFYQRIERSMLSPKGQRRFHALISAPLFLMSIISNMYFLMGKDMGHILMTRGFTSWPIGTPVLLFFMYCGAQTSIEVKNWEIRKELRKLPAID